MALDKAVNRQRGLELAIGLAANGRIDPTDVVPTATQYAAFLDGDAPAPA